MAKADAGLQLLYDNGIWCFPLLPIHDALMVEVEEEYADDVLETVMQGMNSCMWDNDRKEHRFSVPITSDGSVSERWVK